VSVCQSLCVRERWWEGTELVWEVRQSHRSPHTPVTGVSAPWTSHYKSSRCCLWISTSELTEQTDRRPLLPCHCWLWWPQNTHTVHQVN